MPCFKKVVFRLTKLVFFPLKPGPKAAHVSLMLKEADFIAYLSSSRRKALETNTF